MIDIKIPNVTAQQKRMLMALMNMNSQEEVREWVLSQPSESLRREAYSMKEMMLLAFIDEETDTRMAKNLLDRICR